MPDLETKLLEAMVPRDSSDERSAILEVRAGAGGLEASLFAEEIFLMYKNFCGVRRWTFEQLEYSPTDIGGIRDATAAIKGEGAFGRLKYESGVHRVQRVPITGKGGVIHTSTITVAILPEAEDVDVKLEPRDVKIDVMRAGGAGGQHVNKTESAVHLSHQTFARSLGREFYLLSKCCGVASLTRCFDVLCHVGPADTLAERDRGGTHPGLALAAPEQGPRLQDSARQTLRTRARCTCFGTEFRAAIVGTHHRGDDLGVA